MATAMAGASMGSSIAGGWISAIGGIAQAQEEKNKLDQQAEIERYQAMINDKRAAVAQQAGEIEAERRSRQIAVDLGANKAAFAGNGLLLSDGTVANVEDATVAEGQQDIGIIKQNAAMQVWGYQTNAKMQRQSAAEMNRQGKKGVKGARAMAIASIMTGQGSGGAASSFAASLQSNRQASGPSAATYQSTGYQDKSSSYQVSGWRDNSYTFGSKYN